jgi:hypothetical protein
MSRVPIPERGQPLDVAYLSTLAVAVNSMAEDLSSATYNYTTIDTSSEGKVSCKTSEARMIGGFIPVSFDSTVTASQVKSFTYTFPSDFKHAPIVTATPVNNGKTTAGEDVTVVLTDITRGSVTGFVRYNANGQVSTIVNLIIIGIPN